VVASEGGDVRCRGSVKEQMDHAGRLREEAGRSEMRRKEGRKRRVWGREFLPVVVLIVFILLFFDQGVPELALLSFTCGVG
jgi:hypothetical protein